jgi:hypothetical protein
VLIIWQATRNTPMPAIKVNIAVRTLEKLIIMNYKLCGFKMFCKNNKKIK